MLAADVTRTNPVTPTDTATATPPAAAPRPTVDLNALALTDPAAAAAQYRAALPQLSPLQQGELARTAPAAAAFAQFDFDIPGIPDIPGLPGLPSLPDIPSLPGFPNLPGLPGLPSIPGLPDIDLPNPIDIVKGGLDAIGKGLEALQRGAEALKDRLAALPNEAANRLADSLRGDQARTLTEDEKAQIREAFGDNVDVDSVRIVNGPGNNPAAHAAFKIGGNPAITIGNTIYLNPDTNSYSADLGQGGGETGLLIHEFTHVVQYRELGFGSFGDKYARDLAEHDFDRNEVYRYDERQTTYAQETIEGQAEMVGDYAEIRNSTDPADQAKIADLERRLAGTGIYGL